MPRADRSTGIPPSTFLRVTASVVLALLAAKLVGHIPARLVMTLLGAFLVGCGIVWGSTRRLDRTVSHPARALGLAWCCCTTVILGSVYSADGTSWIWFQLTGYDLTMPEELDANLSIGGFVTDHPAFAVDPHDPTRLVLRTGVYDMVKTILIPPGSSLAIQPGTVLRFAAGRSMISYSPIIARGTEARPIVFTARRPWLKWGVVGVVDAGASVFTHVRFEHSRRAIVNQINFPGGLSLIRSDAQITQSQFISSFGKDAVYVLEGHVLVRHNLFRDAYKDGVDLDSGSGQISSNRFIDCDDEGIDLDAAWDGDVFDNEILDSRGGRLAADTNGDAIRARNRFGFSHGVS